MIPSIFYLNLKCQLVFICQSFNLEPRLILRHWFISRLCITLPSKETTPTSASHTKNCLQIGFFRVKSGLKILLKTNKYKKTLADLLWFPPTFTVVLLSKFQAISFLQLAPTECAQPSLQLSQKHSLIALIFIK